MRLSPKLTWGLAWTGLALVLAVPSADFLTGQFGRDNKAAVLTSDTQPVKTAAVEPAAPVKTTEVTTIKTERGVTIVPAGSTPPADPVDKYLSSGKKLPDYITDGDTSAPAKAATPAKPVAPVAAAEDKTEVAAIAPQPVMPRMPLPSSARPGPMAGPPAPVVATTPAKPTAPAKPAAPAVTTIETPVIVDESTLTGSVVPTRPVPPAPIVDDSDNWDNESLRQYLERRGILDDGNTGRSSARVTERNNSTYDPNGFYLNEGPNSDRTNRETRRQRIERMLDEDDGFTLF